MKQLMLVLICSWCLPNYLGLAVPPRMAVFNVGQGQWVTLITETQCLHFDIGGEYLPHSELLQQCRKRVNLAYFSHWDLDHVGLAAKASRTLGHLCLAASPGGPPKGSAQRLLAALPSCSHLPRQASEIEFEKSGKTANDFSRVFLASDCVLIPGDSPKSMERKWISVIPSPVMIRFLILGHHGSRTSTSPELLEALKNLSNAVASSRAKRYGHPHLETRVNLKRRGVPLLTTEDWGNVIFEL